MTCINVTCMNMSLRTRPFNKWSNRQSSGDSATLLLSVRWGTESAELWRMRYPAIGNPQVTPLLSGLDEVQNRPSCDDWQMVNINHPCNLLYGSETHYMSLMGCLHALYQFYFIFLFFVQQIISPKVYF